MVLLDDVRIIALDGPEPIVKRHQSDVRPRHEWLWHFAVLSIARVLKGKKRGNTVGG
jgi:hypothetical protein